MDRAAKMIMDLANTSYNKSEWPAHIRDILMTEMGLSPPASAHKSFAVMGKTFDPAKPDEYVRSFAISRASAA